METLTFSTSSIADAIIEVDAVVVGVASFLTSCFDPRKHVEFDAAAANVKFCSITSYRTMCDLALHR